MLIELSTISLYLHATFYCSTFSFLATVKVNSKIDSFLAHECEVCMDLLLAPKLLAPRASPGQQHNGSENSHSGSTDTKEPNFWKTLGL